jgi:hypothetical protein
VPQENRLLRKYWCELQPSIPLITVYGALYAVWVALVFEVMPDFAAAVLIATILHLMIVLFIASFGGDHRPKAFDAAKKDACGNIVLIGFSAVFLAATAIIGSAGDYRAYTSQWASILQGHQPWNLNEHDFNAYGPLFNVLAPLIWFNPVANKLLFAFSYLVYVIWLIKGYAPKRGLEVSEWFWAGFLLLNLFPWEQIAYYGYFDVLVGLACVASIHSFVGRKDALSGTYLASGILLKFMPIVILPFLAFDRRRFHFRFVVGCVASLVLGFLASILIWGASTFTPIVFAATRRSSNTSIYSVMNSTHWLLWVTPDAARMEPPLLLAAGLALFAWCMLRQVGPLLSSTLAILVTLLFYRVGFCNYLMVFFCLVTYWAVSEWQRFRNRIVLAVLLFGYFNFLAITDFAWWWGIRRNIFHSATANDLLMFLLGCWVLVELLRFPTVPTPTGERVKKMAL